MPAGAAATFDLTDAEASFPGGSEFGPPAAATDERFQLPLLVITQTGVAVDLVADLPRDNVDAGTHGSRGERPFHLVDHLPQSLPKFVRSIHEHFQYVLESGRRPALDLNLLPAVVEVVSGQNFERPAVDHEAHRRHDGPRLCAV